jgi:hypothetical protein
MPVNFVVVPPTVPKIVCVDESYASYDANVQELTVVVAAAVQERLKVEAPYVGTGALELEPP